MFGESRKEIEFPYDLPKTDALQMYFEGDLKVSIRPSGTEPKIKYYFSIRRENTKNDLVGLKAEVTKYLADLEKLFTDKVMKIAQG
jgi:phosphoglucomutase